MKGDIYYEIWHPPPPQDVIFGKKYFGGGGCDRKKNNTVFNKEITLFTPTCGKVGDF